MNLLKKTSNTKRTEDRNAYTYKDEIILEDCSAIIVGKNASQTGKVLFGHNEDNKGNNVMMQHIVPAGIHKSGQLLTFEPACAKIPQIEKTIGYYWSETRASWQAPFSDIFINQCGVAIASDSCDKSREDQAKLINGGIGYGLGHIIAQRAKTAREGVEIAVELVERYGYCGSGRAYEIVDKDEGWVLQIVMGNHYVAKKVPDDEVFFIPNWYTVGRVDIEDKINYIASSDLIEYAQRRGWYIPATKDNSDFNFALAYQNPDQDKSGNMVRHKNALSMILGREPEDIRAFSVRAPGQLGIDHLKKILRSHYEGTEDDLSHNYSINPHKTAKRTICTETTMESMIVQYHEIADLTCIWRTTLNPCTSPYVPWYLGITKVPVGYSWSEPAASLSDHFQVPGSDLSHNPDRAWWAFRDVQEKANSSYSSVIEKITDYRDELERHWQNSQTQIQDHALRRHENSTDKAKEILTAYTCTQAGTAWCRWRELNNVL